jgi:ligand-binding sensor domain-containing protein
MPSYPSAQPAALYQDFPITLVASTDSGVTTSSQFAVGPSAGGAGVTIMIVNTTNQDATGQWAATDVAANYQPLSGCIVTAGSSLAYNLSGGWMRFAFSIAPTSGSLIVSR